MLFVIDYQIFAQTKVYATILRTKVRSYRVLPKSKDRKSFLEKEKIFWEGIPKVLSLVKTKTMVNIQLQVSEEVIGKFGILAITARLQKELAYT